MLIYKEAARDQALRTAGNPARCRRCQFLSRKI